jgi:acetolactate decarboxylase
MRKYFSIVVYGVSLFVLNSIAFASSTIESKNVLFQVSTFSALITGVYDGDYNYKKLMQHGDFGLGTFQGLDGEMVALDGNFYQFPASGKLIRVKPEQKTPFAELVYFKPSIYESLASIPAYTDLYKIIDRLPNKNIPYAVRIDGEFDALTLRSFYKQKKPYTNLSEAAKGQAIFNLKHVKGSMVGFWFPDYWGGIVVPGYHLHFVTTDRSMGGHVLKLSINKAKMSIAPVQQVNFQLPAIESFAKADLSSADILSSIQKIEGGNKQ